MRWLTSCLLAVLLILSSTASHSIDIGPATPMILDAIGDTSFLHDPEGTLTLDEVQSRAADFRPVVGAAAPDVRSVYWVRVLLNSKLSSDREMRIEFQRWGEIDTYLIVPGKPPLQLTKDGNFRAMHNRLTDLNPFATGIADSPSQFQVFTLERGASVELFSRLRANPNNAPSSVIPQLSDHARHLEMRRFGLMIEGIMTGILFAAGMFGWYSALQNRDRTSLLYAIWIMFALMSTNVVRVHDGSRAFEFFFDIEGMQFVRHDLGWALASILSYGQAIGYVLFARSFLDLKIHMPRVHRFTNVYIGFTLAHLVLVNFIDHALPAVVLWGPLAIFIVSILLTIFVCAFRRYRDGLRVAKFFMIAMIPYLFFRTLFMLGSLMQVPSPFALLEAKGFALFMQNPSTAQAVGVCCEALIMGLAVFSKNRWLQDELKQKMQAQAELVETQNQRLEATVAERTRQLLESKADTERQHELVTDSIRYASRLQKALLPRGQRLQGAVRSWHAIWEPRDTIGGDVWWVSPPDADGRVTVVLADSTGHGVPGAMLSVLISTSLERMFATRPNLDPASALLALDNALRIGLNQATDEAESDDGCDAGILRIDPLRREIEFAGAKLGLLHVRADGEVGRIQPTRISLGYQQQPQQEPALEKRSYAPGDMMLMVTDGITDQIGGDDKPRAYGFKRLMPLLERHTGSNATAVADAIREDLRHWQGAQIRRDDATAVVLQLA